MEAAAKPFSVIVVGAGPVGLLASLRLAQAGMAVTVLEALPAVEESPRAMAYQPVAVKELDRAGVLEDVRKVGGRGQHICWRKTKNGEVIAELQRDVTPEHPYENLVIGQHELAAVILKHLQRLENAKVLWSHRVTAVDQSESSEVAVTTENSEGRQDVHRATYLLGADGGRSSVRRLSNITFDGFTFAEQLVSTNVFFPFDKYGWYDGNFCVDPEHWALIAKINQKGLWRVSYGEKDGLTHEELRERLPWKFSQLFPGPKPPQYTLDQFSPYRLNQRCADTFKKGRVLLAGDAAHLTNPFGGLGLTGGLLDAAAVSDALTAVYRGEASDDILERYAEIRRRVFLDVVNPTAKANKRRLHESDPDTVGETDPFLRGLREADAEKKQQIRGHAGLAIDMNQFIKPAATTAAAH